MVVYMVSEAIFVCDLNDYVIAIMYFCMISDV